MLSSKKLGEAVKLIFDVGAHKGEDTDFYLKKGFRVVAVEANPVLAQALRERFAAAIASGQLTLVEAAIAEQEGQVEFFQNETSVWGTIHESWAVRNEKMGARSVKIVVPAVRFDTLLREHGVPYYLKIDIEGADMLCVRALEQMPQRPRFLSIESNKTSWRELVGEFDALRRLGYSRFQLVNQAYVPAQVEPQPVGEGNFANHRFPSGSTGLFGADLPGPWRTRQQTLWRYALIFLQYTFFGDNTWGSRIAHRLPSGLRRLVVPGWYDTHAAQG